MYRIWSRCVLLLVMALPTVPAASVVVRHDRDVAKTLELGRRYPFVCAAAGGTGTLVGPRWVLTAAHVVEGFGPFDFAVRCGDQVFQVDRTCVHEGEEEMPWDRRTHDIALLRLETRVEGLAPAAICREVEVLGEMEELGKTGVIVGTGFFGTAGHVPTKRDGRARAVTNRILDVDDHWLKVVFSRPPGGTDLEGVEAPGDSGGPLLIEVEGVPLVAGVGSYSEFFDAEDDEGSYGILDFYARVSAYASWIDEVVEGVQSGDDSSCAGPRPPREILSAAAGLPSTPVGRRATHYFRAFKSGTAEAFRAFLLEHHADVEPSSASLAEGVEAYRKRWETWGAIELARYTVAPDGLFVEARSRLGKMTFQFTVEPEPPHKLDSITVSSY